jgi:transcriptional regulator with XRE-family HTH domain
MLRQTLETLIKQNLTSAREMAELAGVSTSTIYRWIGGQSQPDFDSIRLLFRHLPNRQAQQALATAFAGDTGWQFKADDDEAEAELDVNHDGRLDPYDALDASIDAVRAAAESLHEVRDACRDGTIRKAEAIHLIQLFSQTIHQCTLTQRILLRLSERRHKLKMTGA